MKNTITFTDSHLEVIQKALEVYTRLRLGQIRIAIDVAFQECHLTWDELELIERAVRPIVFPAKPVLKYDGHGGWYDQYGYSYDESGQRDTEITYDEKLRAARPSLNSPTEYFGITSPEVKDAQLANEIYSTIRQYTSLRKSNGFYGSTTGFNDPLKLTAEPLPEIEGFEDLKTKTFDLPADFSEKYLDVSDSSCTRITSEGWDVIHDTIKLACPELKSKTMLIVKFDDDWTNARVVVNGARREESNLY